MKGRPDKPAPNKVEICVLMLDQSPLTSPKARAALALVRKEAVADQGKGLGFRIFLSQVGIDGGQVAAWVVDRGKFAVVGQRLALFTPEAWMAVAALGIAGKGGKVIGLSGSLAFVVGDDPG